jgi:hypothetical protein
MHCIVTCTCMHLKSFLRYKFPILDTHYPDAVYLGEHACGDPWLFFETKRGPLAKKKKKGWETGFYMNLL